jgi:hypothetical protein
MTFLFLFELFIKYNEKVFILGIILIKKISVSYENFGFRTEKNRWKNFRLILLNISSKFIINYSIYIILINFGEIYPKKKSELFRNFSLNRPKLFEIFRNLTKSSEKTENHPKKSENSSEKIRNSFDEKTKIHKFRIFGTKIYEFKLI